MGGRTPWPRARQRAPNVGRRYAARPARDAGGRRASGGLSGERGRRVHHRRSDLGQRGSLHGLRFERTSVGGHVPTPEAAFESTVKSVKVAGKWGSLVSNESAIDIRG